MKPLGTIYANASQLARYDRISDRIASETARRVESMPELSACERRAVGGEIRYYSSAAVYATANHGRVRWFEVRQDGDYALKLKS